MQNCIKSNMQAAINEEGQHSTLKMICSYSYIILGHF